MQEQLKSIIECIALWKVRNSKTEEDLAGELGISRETLRLKKKGLLEFKMSELLKMCELFGCDANRLLGL